MGKKTIPQEDIKSSMMSFKSSNEKLNKIVIDTLIAVSRFIEGKTRLVLELFNSKLNHAFFRDLHILLLN